MREIKHLSVHQWLRSAIPDSPTSPIGFLLLKLPPPPCAALLVNKVILVIPTLETFPYTYACIYIMAVVHTLKIIEAPLQ